MTAPIYLDYAATTPVDPAVAAAMAPWAGERFGNPASPHAWGYAADAAIGVARTQVAALLGADPATVAFTGGATEAVNWALKGVLLAAPAGRRRLVTIATEHSCVLESARWLESIGCGLTVLGVGRDGLVDQGEVAAALGPDVALVSAMLVNNETGVIQPVAAIAALAHAAGALMHCDAAQGFGKVACDALDADLVTVSGHKIYGPKGVGALIRRPGVALVPLLHGGGQEDGRSGTLSPALCVGLGTAAAVAGAAMAADAAHAAGLAARLLDGLGVPVTVNGGTAPRWPGVIEPVVRGRRHPPARRRPRARDLGRVGVCERAAEPRARGDGRGASAARQLRAVYDGGRDRRCRGGADHGGAATDGAGGMTPRGYLAP